MPVVIFELEWPDGTRQRCTSPSTVIYEHLRAGQALPVGDLVATTHRAMAAASERVRARYGFACTAAAAQQEAIEQAAADHGRDGGLVTVLAVRDAAQGAAA